MCGIVGVAGTFESAKEVFLGLISLQHRGQDAAGILSYDGRFHEIKNKGLVENVFGREAMHILKGSLAIGHTRYSTAGTGDLREVQPLTLNYPYGMGLVHNGNIVNAKKIQERLLTEKKRHCFSSSDSEGLLNWFADGLKGSDFPALLTAAGSVFENVHGSYSIIGLLAERGVFAFRDPSGIRPLVLGEKVFKEKKSYMLASETIALQASGYEVLRDIEPGEVIFIEEIAGKDPVIHSKVLAKKDLNPCMFEWVYFASAESEWEKAPVYRTRLELGRALAKIIKGKIDKGEIKADLVAPVPDTSRPAASALAEELGLPFREILIKNRYIKRTFILSSQTHREQSVDLKLNPVKSEIQGKSIILVDDSIVRGTTSKKIVDLVRRSGAKNVYFVSTCPPIRYPCFYGIDFPDKTELLASNKTDEEIRKAIGADQVIYLGIDELKNCLNNSSGGRVKNPCMACLTGDYPTDVSEAQRFSDSRKKERTLVGN